MKIEGITFTIKRSIGDKLFSFWKDHGSHFEFCLGKKDKILLRKMQENKKPKKEKKEKFVNILSHPVVLAGQEYMDLNEIKSNIRKIIGNNSNSQKLEKKDEEFVLDILKYHKNANNKLDNFDYFTVDIHEEHKSRCLFIVKKNNEREDVSLLKCVDNIRDSQNN